MSVTGVVTWVLPSTEGGGSDFADVADYAQDCSPHGLPLSTRRCLADHKTMVGERVNVVYSLHGNVSSRPVDIPSRHVELLASSGAELTFATYLPFEREDDPGEFSRKVTFEAYSEAEPLQVCATLYVAGARRFRGQMDELGMLLIDEHRIGFLWASPSMAPHELCETDPQWALVARLAQLVAPHFAAEFAYRIEASYSGGGFTISNESLGNLAKIHGRLVVACTYAGRRTIDGP